MSATAPEYGTTEDNDPEATICICGNHTADEGFIDSSPEGMPAWTGLSATPEGLAEYSAHFTCPVCGRVYSDAAIRQTGKALVVTRIDAHAEPFLGGLRAYRTAQGD